MDIKSLLKIEDPVKRRAMFVAFLTKEILKRGGMPPIIVGCEAVEIYTQGSYTTGDIDVLAELDILESVLSEWGFLKTGRLWLSKDLDIYIDWRGSDLEGKEPEIVKITDDLQVSVIAVEDLIIDRLKSAKWWGDTDSLMWAKVLINIKRAIGVLDYGYLKEEAKKQDIEGVLMKVIEE